MKQWEPAPRVGTRPCWPVAPAVALLCPWARQAVHARTVLGSWGLMPFPVPHSTSISVVPKSWSPRFLSPFKLHSDPFQYSYLKNPMDRGAWQAAVHRVTKSQTQLKQLSTCTHIFKLNDMCSDPDQWEYPAQHPASEPPSLCPHCDVLSPSELAFPCGSEANVGQALDWKRKRCVWNWK